MPEDKDLPETNPATAAEGAVPPGDVPGGEALESGAGQDPVGDPMARIAELEAENERLKNEYMRALADAQNAKRMADKRISDNSKYAVSNFAKAVLTVADNLSRALMAAPESLRSENEALKSLAVGVEMTAKELEGALGQHGVKRVDALNTPFDPNFHQAVQEVENTAVPTGTVVQVFQDGYVVHDRLLRPAMVVVSRGGPKREAVAEAAAPAGVDRTI